MYAKLTIFLLALFSLIKASDNMYHRDNTEEETTDVITGNALYECYSNLHLSFNAVAGIAMLAGAARNKHCRESGFCTTEDQLVIFYTTAVAIALSGIPTIPGLAFALNAPHQNSKVRRLMSYCVLKQAILITAASLAYLQDDMYMSLVLSLFGYFMFLFQNERTKPSL
jgi:hypothetical protein